MKEDKNKKEYKVIVSEQVVDFLKKESERCDEENDIDLIEMRAHFKDFMKGADIIKVFPDSESWEWREDFFVSRTKQFFIKVFKLFGIDIRPIRRTHWMDMNFSRNGDYTSPLCVVTTKLVEDDKKMYKEIGEAWEESEWDIIVDVPYLTRESALIGVKMWINRYYPEFSHLQVVYEDDEIVKKMQDQIWEPILEKCKQAEQDIADGKFYTMEDIKKEFDLDE